MFKPLIRLYLNFEDKKRSLYVRLYNSIFSLKSIFVKSPIVISSVHFFLILLFQKKMFSVFLILLLNYSGVHNYNLFVMSMYLTTFLFFIFMFSKILYSLCPCSCPIWLSKNNIIRNLGWSPN